MKTLWLGDKVLCGFEGIGKISLDDFGALKHFAEGFLRPPQMLRSLFRLVNIIRAIFQMLMDAEMMAGASLPAGGVN